MKTIAMAVAVFAFTACASGPSPRAPIAKAKAKAPVIESPQHISGSVDLSGLDEIQVMKLMRSGPVRTDLKVCVAPSGQVSKAEILHGSGQEWLEQAILASVLEWSYRPFRSIAGLQRCHMVRVDLNS